MGWNERYGLGRDSLLFAFRSWAFDFEDTRYIHSLLVCSEGSELNLLLLESYASI